MNINFITDEQLWDYGTTRYWFDVDGDDYAISDCNGEVNLISLSGEVLTLDGRNLKIFEALSELYLNEI